MTPNPRAERMMTAAESARKDSNHQLPYGVGPDVQEGTKKVHVWRCPIDGGVWLTQTCGFGGTHERVTVVTTVEILKGHL